MSKSKDKTIADLSRMVDRLSRQLNKTTDRLYVALRELELVYERHGYVDDVIDERHREAIKQCSEQ